MQDNNQNSSPNKVNQGRDGEAEQKARQDKYKEEAEQLFELHRQNKLLSPSVFLGILNAYLLFVTAVAAFGVVAFYSNHIATLESVFVTCIILLLAAPISAVWYLFGFRTNPIESEVPKYKSLLDKLTQSSVGTFLARLGQNRFARIVLYSLLVLNIEEAIRKWPSNPRFSLGVIVLNMAFIVLLAALAIASWSSGLIKMQLDVL